MTKGLDEQVHTCNLSLADTRYLVFWEDDPYEKVRADGRIISMAVLSIRGVDDQRRRDIVAVEPMPEESEDFYSLLFRTLQERGLTPRLVSYFCAHDGLAAAIRKRYPGAS